MYSKRGNNGDSYLRKYFKQIIHNSTKKAKKYIKKNHPEINLIKKLTTFEKEYHPFYFLKTQYH